MLKLREGAQGIAPFPDIIVMRETTGDAMLHAPTLGMSMHLQILLLQSRIWIKMDVGVNGKGRGAIKSLATCKNIVLIFITGFEILFLDGFQYSVHFVFSGL